MIFFHELGHFLVAKRAGVRVDEFALGFGPAIWRRQRGETLYALRLIPLGGYVRMAGMYPGQGDEVPLEDRMVGASSAGAPVEPGRAFADKTVGQRMAIIAAGPLANFLLAVLLFVVAFSAVGIPQPTLTVSKLVPGAPAELAGILPGDRVVAIDGRRLKDWDDLASTIAAKAGVPIDIEVQRDHRSERFRITPKLIDGRGIIGIYPKYGIQHFGVAASVGIGAKNVVQVTTGWFDAMAKLLSGRGRGDLMGPVGIGEQIAQQSRTGLANVLVLAAVLSTNLGLVNLLPIPALDGSRLLFLLWEKLRGKPIDPEKEGFVHFVGFALMILLSLFIAYRDILRITQG